MIIEAWLLGCGGSQITPWWLGDDDDTSTGGHSGETTDTTPPAPHTGVPVHTGLTPLPGCTDAPDGCVYLTGQQSGASAGRWVSVADVDGDGQAEALVSESALNWDLTDHAVHLFRGRVAPGTIRDAALVHYDEVLRDWGETATLLPRAHQIAIEGPTAQFDPQPQLYFFDAAAGSATSAAQAVGSVAESILIGFPGFVTGCAIGSAPIAVCATSSRGGSDDVWPYSGGVFVFEAPVVGLHEVTDFRAHYLGDDGDTLQLVTGERDLTGDGRPDLVVGADQGAGGFGRVAVVHDGPDGEHRLWDITDTTLTGAEQYAGFGQSVATGDLDGDGLVDLFVGAPFGEAGAGYGFRGPLAPGDHLASDADWTFVSTTTPGWYGYKMAVGDFDGDGRPDLAIGDPNGYDSDEAGSVDVFRSPAPGRYLSTDATVTLQSGVGLRDWFGYAMEAGDLDQDGRDDLVIGAPLDPQHGRQTGSVTVFYGGGLPAPPTP